MDLVRKRHLFLNSYGLGNVTIALFFGLIKSRNQCSTLL